MSNNLATINKTLTGLAGRLVSEQILTSEQAQQASQEAGKMKVSLVRYLVESLDVDSQDLAELAAQEFGVPLFDLNAIDRATIPDKIISADLMSRHHAVPLSNPMLHFEIAELSCVVIDTR